VSNRFNTVMQGTKTVQELMNELTNYATHMIQQPDEYMLWQHFVSVLQNTLCNKVLNVILGGINRLYPTYYMLSTGKCLSRMSVGVHSSTRTHKRQ
jgi:hypothetical protein